MHDAAGTLLMVPVCHMPAGDPLVVPATSLSFPRRNVIPECFRRGREPTVWNRLDAYLRGQDESGDTLSLSVVPAKAGTHGVERTGLPHTREWRSSRLRGQDEPGDKCLMPACAGKTIPCYTLNH